MFFGNDPRPGDTEHIVAEKDEYVVNRNAARKHKSLLDFINYVDEPRFDGKEMAHSAIDEAIALNTMSEVGMQGGGRIKGVDEFPVGGIGVVREQFQDPSWRNQSVMAGGRERNLSLLNSEDKRDRKGGYSLGVKDYYAQALGEFERMGDFVGEATGSNRRNILEAAQEAGAIMETQEALDALKLIANRHQQGTMNVMANPRKYQDGGMISYGGESSEMPTLEELYSMAGIQPNDEQREQFESQYTYDPSREKSTVAGYMQGLEDFRTTGASQIGRARQQAQGAGSGFAGFGARQEMSDTATQSAQQQYGSTMERTQRGMFQDLRSQRESYIQDALARLGYLEGIGGTEEYEEQQQWQGNNPGGQDYGFAQGAPPLPGAFDGQVQKGTDGMDWSWNGSEWVVMEQSAQRSTGGTGGGTGDEGGGSTSNLDQP